MMKKMMKALLLVPAMFMLPLAANAADYQLGQHYAEVGKQMPSNDVSEKVKVVELFSYSCPHCFRLDPQVTQWKETLPDNAEFELVPAIFRDSWLQLARVFYAAEQSGDLEMLHPKLFHAIHVEKRRLNSEEELLDFVEEQGIDREDFLKRMNSFGVKTKVKKALVMSQTSGITGVPAMIVDAKYRTDAPQAGSLEDMLDVVDYLVVKAAEEK
ncbi:thiol:disulfide interchange protein DsbA/DsbL [Methylophaga sp. OBS3]|jgi:thiol:disulfide interchange protein DsbA|uniref:thiol:disulfide interchange protein DsbA/DsbL n=1 Tax=Methylophaga sp. OBS3 TaxID=2991934 RepID=UPI0022574FE1|nr:thiol:disulfide interchange protein DsbA/DsbL [Methylophaga sp. OBS3]MCX4190526.1 thiol:disulfide interchange protein DsbA/DsbL [Methylophaga sp. OBS3]